MAGNRRIVGSDRPGVQPIQTQAIQGGNDMSDELLKGASQANVYGYNMLQQGVESLGKMTAQHTENAIAQNNVTTQMAVTAAQNAGKSEAKFAQEMANVSQLMQQWDTSNQQKKARKEDAAFKERAYQDERADKEDARWFRDISYRDETIIRKDTIDDREDTQQKEMIKDLLKTRSAEEAARVEKLAKEDEAAAYLAIQDIVLSMPQDAYQQNPLYVRNKLNDTLGRFKNVRPEKIAEIMTPAFSKLQGITTDMFSKKQENAEKVHTQIVEQKRNKIETIATGILARIKNNTSGDITPLLDEMESLVNGAMKDDTSIGVLDVLTIQNHFLNKVNENVSISADNRAKIAAQLDNNAGFVNEYGPLLEELNSGQLTYQGFKLKLNDLATKYSMPLEQAVDLGDPTANQKFLVDGEETAAKLRALRQEGQMQDVDPGQLTDMQIGLMAWHFNMKPDQYNLMKTDPVLSKHPVFRRAEGAMQSYQKFTVDYAQLNKDYTRLQQAQLALGQETLAAAKRAPEGSTDFKKVMQEQIKVLFPGQVDTSGMNAEQYQTWEAFRKGANDLINTQLGMNRKEASEMYARMQQYGLHEGAKSVQFTDAKYKALQQQIFQMEQAVSGGQSNAPPGAQPNFKQGSPSKSSTQFARSTYKGTSILLPFKAGTQFSLGDGYGAAGSPNHGRNRPHDGLDIPAAQGTPILATGGGTVKLVAWDQKGYGNFMDIQFDDGSIQRFAHMVGTFVTEGQRVQLGQTIGKVGSTGDISTGPHLHWEFRKASARGHENALDPIMNANRLMSTVGTVRPRGDNLDWQSNSNPYGGTHPKSLGALIPKDAVPLLGGSYLLNGKVHYVPGSDGTMHPPAPATTYNNRNVMKGSAVPRDKIGFKASRDNTPNKNYHYAVLAKDNDFRAAVHKTATNLNIPAHWLADVMAFETSGSFSPSIDNGVGYTGLVQFGDDAAKDIGTTRSALAKMSRAQQMQYVEKHLKKHMQYAGISEISNIETLLGLVWGGGGFVRKFIRNPASVKGVSDSNTDFVGYLNKLGSHGGRKYNHIYNERRASVSHVTHTSYTDGCPMCNQMVASNSPVVPHEGQA